MAYNGERLHDETGVQVHQDSQPKEPNAAQVATQVHYALSPKREGDVHHIFEDFSYCVAGLKGGFVSMVHLVVHWLR